jgi:hypothetical protein
VKEGVWRGRDDEIWRVASGWAAMGQAKSAHGLWGNFRWLM